MCRLRSLRSSARVKDRSLYTLCTHVLEKMRDQKRRVERQQTRQVNSTFNESLSIIRAALVMTNMRDLSLHHGVCIAERKAALRSMDMVVFIFIVAISE